MGRGLIVERTVDALLVQHVMSLPEILETVAEDGFEGVRYVPDVVNEAWLSMTDGDNLVALYNVHSVNSVTVQIHAQVMPDYRKTDLGKETGAQALKWIIENTKAEKVIAWVPEIYPNVRRFTEIFGFVEEGINRKSYLKNGELCDQWLMGITRAEINGQIS